MDDRHECPVNFHGYIAIPLEEIAKKLLLKQDFSADGIESGNFVAIMALIVGSHGDSEEAERFLRESSAYLGKSAREIGIDAALKIYDRFKKIIGEN